VVYDAIRHEQASLALREVEQKIERARVVAQEALEQYARKKTIQALCAELMQLKKVKEELEQKIAIEQRCEIRDQWQRQCSIFSGCVCN
jgi:predicted nucleotidyltransferase